jgi:hypothetical protein
VTATLAAASPILNALVPVFLLILVGFGLKRMLLTEERDWVGIERLAYYVLFPALLVVTLSRADLGAVDVAGVGGALALTCMASAVLCYALKPVLDRGGMTGPAFTSLFQGAVRWNSFVALAVAGNLFGPTGVTLAAVAIVAMIPLVNVLSVYVLARHASGKPLSAQAFLKQLATNPLIIACALGLLLNTALPRLPEPLHVTLDVLGRATLGVGLLVVGAGLDVRRLTRADPVLMAAVALKLVGAPLVGIGLGVLFGVGGAGLAVIAIAAAVPSASNGYILARQLGGDAPLMAAILTAQTLLAALTMPLALVVATLAGG